MEDERSKETIFYKKNLSRKRPKVRFSHGLEPSVFAIYFAFNLTSAVLQNQILKQTCLTMDFDKVTCDNLNSENHTKEVEEAIQPKMANINMTLLILNSIVPAALSLIIGSWSDVYGRKKILIISFSGYTTTLALITLFSYISDNIKLISPWWYLVAEMPMTFAGGWPLLDIAFCCYIADLSSDETRSFRLGFIGFLNIMGNVSAYFSSSFILSATNLTTVFLIAFLVCLIGFLWMIFFIDETVMPPENMSLTDQIKEITSKERMQEIIYTFRKYREKNGRKILWFLVLIAALVVSTMHGVATLNYLFVREKFGWKLREWTIFESSNTLISALGLFIGLMIFKKLMKISDMKLAMFGLSLSVVDATFKALATRPFHLYLSSGITLFRLISMPMIRSIVSVVVAHDEIGKVYSLTTCLEALSGLGAGPLYNAVYQNTFTTFPGAFYLLTAGIFAINLILTIFVARWVSRGKVSN